MVTESKDSIHDERLKDLKQYEGLYIFHDYEKTRKRPYMILAIELEEDLGYRMFYIYVDRMTETQEWIASYTQMFDFVKGELRRQSCTC